MHQGMVDSCNNLPRPRRWAREDLTGLRFMVNCRKGYCTWIEILEYYRISLASLKGSFFVLESSNPTALLSITKKICFLNAYCPLLFIDNSFFVASSGPRKLSTTEAHLYPVYNFANTDSIPSDRRQN